MPEMVPAAARGDGGEESEEECQPLHLAPPSTSLGEELRVEVGEGLRLLRGQLRLGGQLLGLELRLFSRLEDLVRRVDVLAVDIVEFDAASPCGTSLPPFQMLPRLMVNWAWWFP